MWKIGYQPIFREFKIICDSCFGTYTQKSEFQPYCCGICGSRDIFVRELHPEVREEGLACKFGE